MSEAALWRYLRDKLLPAGIHATRIENGVSAGFPDVHYSISRGNKSSSSGTIELKFLRKKKPPFGEGGLNQDQIAWIRDEVEAGGTVWIVAQIEKKIYWVRGGHYEEFNFWTDEDFFTKSTLIFVQGKRQDEAKANLEIFL